MVRGTDAAKGNTARRSSLVRHSWLATLAWLTLAEQHTNEHTDEPFQFIRKPVDYFPLFVSDCHPIAATFVVKQFTFSYIFYREKPELITFFF